jgi:hypothetical protein
MTDERWRISTLQAMCLVGLATVQAYENGIYGITGLETPLTQTEQLAQRDLPQRPPIQAQQELVQQELVQQVLAEQAMGVDPHHAEVSNSPPMQQDAIEGDEAAREAWKALYEVEKELAEELKRKDELDERVNQPPDPVNQAEIRPGLEPQDPRLTAMDRRHEEQLRNVDVTTQRSEADLRARHQGDPALDGLVETLHSGAATYRESLVKEQAAERQQLRQEVYAEQQRTVNQQQQITAPVPPPPVPPPPVPPPTR